VTVQQDTLFGEAPTPSRNDDGLGVAQQAVLAALEEHGDLTDDEAGSILHERRGKHSAETRCEWCARDGRQVLVSLGKRGKVTHRRTGEWTPPGPRARRTDPATSHAAARRLGDLRETQLLVLELFAEVGPMHDELMIAMYRHRPRPLQSDSGLRTRRRELYDQQLLRANGETATTECGRASAVWEITDNGRETLAAHNRVPY
jgi:hypothetical protein